MSAGGWPGFPRAGFFATLHGMSEQQETHAAAGSPPSSPSSARATRARRPSSRRSCPSSSSSACASGPSSTTRTPSRSTTPARTPGGTARPAREAYVIASPERLAFITKLDGELPLTEIVGRYYGGFDIVVAEGYKRTAPHRVELFRVGAGPRRAALRPRRGDRPRHRRGPRARAPLRPRGRRRPRRASSPPASTPCASTDRAAARRLRCSPPLDAPAGSLAALAGTRRTRIPLDSTPRAIDDARDAVELIRIVDYTIGAARVGHRARLPSATMGRCGYGGGHEQDRCLRRNDAHQGHQLLRRPGERVQCVDGGREGRQDRPHPPDALRLEVQEGGSQPLEVRGAWQHVRAQHEDPDPAVQHRLQEARLLARRASATR